MANAVVYTDKGLKKLLERLAKNTSLGRVGVLGSDGSTTHPLREDLTIAEVAAINEFGSSKASVPRRSFLKSTFQKDVFKEAMIKAGKDVVFGIEPRTTLQNVGRVMAEEVRKTLDEGVMPENAPSTIKKKGHDHTLLDTGTLRRAITHDVVTKTGEGEMDVEMDDRVLGTDRPDW